MSSRVYNDLAVLLPLAFPQRSLIFVVQTSEVVDIEKRWVAVGRPKCAHERASSEFYLGSRTAQRSSVLGPRRDLDARRTGAATSRRLSTHLCEGMGACFQRC